MYDERTNELMAMNRHHITPLKCNARRSCQGACLVMCCISAQPQPAVPDPADCCVATRAHLRADGDVLADHGMVLQPRPGAQLGAPPHDAVRHARVAVHLPPRGRQVRVECCGLGSGWTSSSGQASRRLEWGRRPCGHHVTCRVRRAGSAVRLYDGEQSACPSGHVIMPADLTPHAWTAAAPHRLATLQNLLRGQGCWIAACFGGRNWRDGSWVQGRRRFRPHLDAVQEDAVGEPHAVADLAQRADRHVGPDLAAAPHLHRPHRV